tara:strand:+ start:334 stop:459 length:126 start_codon:yes stop_codon:yes gene_type:complete
VRKQIEVLKNHPDIATYLRQIGFGIGDLNVLEKNFTAVGFF